MSSERRLHPVSVLFGIGARLKELALPLIVVLFTAGRSGLGWQVWLLWLLVPYAIIAIGRVLTFRYRYDEHELVIRTGLIFRNERHVPYARIQNVDGVQTIFHRMLKVVDVKVQTAGGNEPEATMSVLPVAAFEEMRLRVVEGRRLAESGIPSAAEDAAVRQAPEARTLLRLSPRELLLYGFVEGRGMVVIAALFGLWWEFDMAERFMPAGWGVIDREVISDENRPRPDRGLRTIVQAAYARTEGLFVSVLAGAAAVVALLLAVRLLSMVWAAIRLHGFVLSRSGDDLRTEYGLITHVAATIPLGRIQTLTLKEGPLHRLVRRVSARVDTAGGEAGQNAPPDRHWLAPLVRRGDLPALASEVMPALDVGALPWQPVHPRAFGRAFREALVVSLLLCVPLTMSAGWWGLAALLVLVPWSLLHARCSVAALGWALTDDLVAFRSGWIWKHTTVAPLARVQAVTFYQSPFDRRAKMARVRVDTAGAGDLSHRVAIPYLGREAAHALWQRLSHEAARRTFRWS